jgi:NADH:ubiquinone oxidoreductase subunit B-like Fe-S oxidoreductase
MADTYLILDKKAVLYTVTCEKDDIIEVAIEGTDRRLTWLERHSLRFLKNWIACYSYELMKVEAVQHDTP